MPDTTPLKMQEIQDLRESLAELPDDWVTHTKRDVVALLAGDINARVTRALPSNKLPSILSNAASTSTTTRFRDALPL
ncbi:MAG: hypothetical protein R3F40_18960 [Candidatus Competibacteraceae bacterium]